MKRNCHAPRAALLASIVSPRELPLYLHSVKWTKDTEESPTYFSDGLGPRDEGELLPPKVLSSNHMVLLIMPRFESSKMSHLRLAAAHLGIVMTIRSLKLRCYLFDQR